MGCHTWFKVPQVTDPEEIKKYAFQHINKCGEDGTPYFNSDQKKVMVFAINNSLSGFYGEYAAAEFYGGSFINGIIYLDVEEWSLQNEYNPKNNTNYICKYDLSDTERLTLESYWDSPRIGGYPERLVTSYEDMKDFMRMGYTD